MIIDYIHTNKILSNFNMNSFVSNVMQTLVGLNIFTQFKEHINDQYFINNHINHLLQIIIQLYCKTRLTHYVKNTNVNDRYKFNKLILFKGQ